MTYRVSMRGFVFATVSVEADSPAEAEKKALASHASELDGVETHTFEPDCIESVDEVKP